MTQLSSKVVMAMVWFAGLAAAQATTSTAPAVGKVVMHTTNPHIVHLTVSWPNSWRNERNHDAAWLTLRGPDASKGPVLLAKDGHTATKQGGGTAVVQAAADGTGAFIAPATEHRGDVTFDVTLRVRDDIPEDVRAWAVGMVYIPAGGFDLGDDEPLARKFGAFHGQTKKQGGALTPDVFVVHDESAIDVADKPGSLWYATDRNQYRGDQGGPIPAAWPKGTQAFYVMKHELRQGAYAAFLSTLPKEWQQRRAPLDLSGEETTT